MRFYLIVKSFFKIYKAALFSGVLLGCAFIPFPFFTWFFALVPLWYFISQAKTLRSVLVGAFITQFLATFIGFNWVMLTVHIFGQMNLFLSFLILLLFCCFANLYLSLSAGFWYFLSKNSSSFLFKLLLFPVLYALFHSLIPTLFPWNMGYPWLWGGLWGLQTAELWGFRFLNTLFYVFNLLFLVVYYHSKKGTRSFSFKKIKSVSFQLDSKGQKALATACLLFVSLNLLGLFLKQRLPDTDGKLKVIIIQHNRNALQDRKDQNSRVKTLSLLRQISYKALQETYRENKTIKDIDFILWSEGAYPFPIKEYKKHEALMESLIQPVGVPIITGGLSLSSDQTVKNSIFIFNEKGKIVKPVHNKTKLLIFGETFPLIDRFPVLRQVFPYFGGGMQAGKELQTNSLNGVSYAWQVCYEVLFDRISREFANKKSQVIINVSNDSWYGYPQQPLQHLTMSFARAIELRQPMIRSTNTGFSGVIALDGTVQKLSPFNEAWYGIYEVPYYKKPLQTLFMGWGYYINELFLFVLVLVMGFLQISAQRFKE